MGLLSRTEFVLLSAPTRHQPETIARGIVQGKIRGPIYIKDCDNFFRDTPTPCNQVACYDLHLIEKVNARSKSYIEVNGDGFVVNIVEKKVIGSKFCTGGYSFASESEYMKYFDRLSNEPDLYLSHIIFEMILNNVAFSCSDVSDYVDWGTIKEWKAYTCLYSTLFIDLDGTMVFNSAQHSTPQWGETEGIQPNIDVVNYLYNSGNVEVILTTSRKKSFREVTLAQIDRVGLKFHDIIFGLPHGRRIIINDYAPSNPFKSCDAINIKRNSTDLKEMLEDSIGLHLDSKVDEKH
jgi:hypothetical protein